METGAVRSVGAPELDAMFVQSYMQLVVSMALKVRYEEFVKSLLPVSPFAPRAGGYAGSGGRAGSGAGRPGGDVEMEG